MNPQPKWILINGEWVIRWFILTTKPMFKETPASPGAANTGEGR